MRIKFHYIEWQNLFSYGAQPTRVELDSHHTTLMVGLNGHGKSTIMDAITFALFNKPWRKINKGELINTLNGKGLLTTIEFSIGSKRYKIIRGSKPNIFEIYCNDELLPSQTGKDQQTFLEEHILRLNHKTFCQVIILGKSFVPFMQLSTPDRRAIVEDLLDISIFSDMSEYLKKTKKEVEEEQDNIERDLNKETHALDMKKQHIQQLQEILSKQKARQENTRKRYDDAIKKRDKLKKQLKTLYKTYDHWVALNDELDAAERAFEKLEIEHERLHKELRKFETKVNAKCPTCNQPLPHDSLAFQKSKKEAEKAFEECGLKLEEAINAQKNAEVKLSNNEFKDIEDKVQEHSSSLKSINRELELLEEQLDEENTAISEDDIDKELKEQEKITKSIRKLEKKLTELSTIHEAYEMALEITRSDIKKYIVRSYIPLLNSNINKYLTHLGLHAKFELDESFEETIRLRETDNISYYGLSEGQKSRIDLAILFAWRAVASHKNSVSTNLLFLDEILDTSMDANGCEAFLSNLIAEEAKDTNIFIISHREEAISEYFDRVLKFEIKGLFSTMKEVKT